MAAAGATCQCGCRDPRGATVHVIATALAADDLDRALEAGLLACIPCPGCTRDCSELVVEQRDARRVALAARERFRARNARLQQRAQARAARRAVASPPATEPSQSPRPALPSAAAAALARARARVASKQ
jgi:hypothetical protein